LSLWFFFLFWAHFRPQPPTPTDTPTDTQPGAPPAPLDAPADDDAPDPIAPPVAPPLDAAPLAPEAPPEADTPAPSTATPAPDAPAQNGCGSWPLAVAGSMFEGGALTLSDAPHAALVGGMVLSGAAGLISLGTGLALDAAFGSADDAAPSEGVATRRSRDRAPARAVRAAMAY
jgi:hypothetical protein